MRQQSPEENPGQRKENSQPTLAEDITFQNDVVKDVSLLEISTSKLTLSSITPPPTPTPEPGDQPNDVTECRAASPEPTYAFNSDSLAPPTSSSMTAPDPENYVSAADFNAINQKKSCTGVVSNVVNKRCKCLYRCKCCKGRLCGCADKVGPTAYLTLIALTLVNLFNYIDRYQRFFTNLYSEKIYSECNKNSDTRGPEP